MVYVICVTAVVVTAMLCFKGITVNRKTGNIPDRVVKIAPRPVEFDEMEERLNRVNTAHSAGLNDPDFKPREDTLVQSRSAMDAVLRNLQDVFGPENTDGGENVDGR